MYHKAQTGQLCAKAARRHYMSIIDKLGHFALFACIVQNYICNYYKFIVSDSNILIAPLFAGGVGKTNIQRQQRLHRQTK